MARFNWLQGWRAHALMRLIRCLGEQTHRTQNTRELADALRWTTAAVRAAACVESDGAELVPVVEECDGQGLIKAPVGTQAQLADAQELMLSAMPLGIPPEAQSISSQSLPRQSHMGLAHNLINVYIGFSYSVALMQHAPRSFECN
jgi:hypothetical protein